MGITLQCIPVYAIWDQRVEGKCINSSIAILIAAGIGIFEDIVIILLPVPELKGLNLCLRKRLAVMFMLALGSLYAHLSYL